MEALIYSDNHDNLLRQQGIAQALIAVLGLPSTLEDEIIAERFRVATRAGFPVPTGNGKLPLDGPTSPEEY